MSGDAECNMGSRVRETGMSRPWVGKGEWQRANTDKNLLPVLAVWPSQVWEVCESLDVSTTESNQPSKQTYRWATAWGSCDLSCPVPSAHCRALEEPAHSPVGPGAGHTTATSLSLWGSLDKKFKTSPTFAFHSAKQEQNTSFFIFQMFCAFQDLG